MLIIYNRSLCLLNLILVVSSETYVLDAPLPSEPRKNLNSAKTNSVAGRVNFKPWSSPDDEKTNEISISINPNYDDASFDIALRSDTEDGSSKLRNCVLQLTKQYKSLSYLDVPKTNYSSHRCSWSNLQIIPGRWYLFTVFLDGRKIANFWQPIEPIFDSDRFVSSVISRDNRISIQFKKKFIENYWKRLIGQDGEILVKTSATNWTIAIERKPTKEKGQYIIDNLSYGRCYSVEMMSATSNILSFNRTWFYVRTSAPKLVISLKNVTKHTATIDLNEENGNAETDPSCSAILTLHRQSSSRKNKHPMNRYIFLGTRKSIALDDLNPDTKYTVGGVSQCGQLSELCLLKKKPIDEQEFITPKD